MKLGATAAIAALTLLFAVPALSSPEGWMRSLEDGQKAARQSGKPILVVTAWKEGV